MKKLTLHIGMVKETLDKRVLSGGGEQKREPLTDNDLRDHLLRSFSFGLLLSHFGLFFEAKPRC